MTEADVLDSFGQGCATCASLVRYQALRQMFHALEALVPIARGEFDWGAIDALADEARFRPRRRIAMVGYSKGVKGRVRTLS
jgi:hypothetical protein